MVFNSDMVTLRTTTVSLFSVLVFFLSCQKQASLPPQFELLTEQETGIDFQNVLTADSIFNPLTYMYFYNGGGVAAGDFNQDGLVDLYFTANMSGNRLYLNEGNLKFKDITAIAGVGGNPGWTCGASVVDLNNDGLLDIYVSQVGDFLSIKGRNHLYICKEIKDGIPIFEEKAAEYGLDLVGFGTQAAFFDYDLDGDLDLYQLNHSVHANGTFGQKKTFEGVQHPLAGDKLMRNDWIPAKGQPKGGFKEVTLEAGIKCSVIGYGLSVVTGDINNDGWPDIYIGNDFHENDYLYLNQKDGTFKEVLTQQIQHASQFSMGADIGDINNDGWGDIISLDMLPEDPYILKSSLGEDEFNLYQFKQTYGYAHQFARNALQRNNGDGTFSEIGMFAGVHATDWSWATLFVDFDNDGYKDLFISNGILRRMNDIDYANFRLNSDVRFKSGMNNLENKDLAVIDLMPKIKLPNKFFHNKGGQLHFEDFEQRIKGSLPSFSNGAMYADLDNDGDLELIVNNLEDAPFIYKNLQTEQQKPASDYLSIQLKGSPGNPNAIGSRVLVFKKQECISQEHFSTRGYQSSAVLPLHVGIGDGAQVDSVILIWPDQRYERINPQFNQRQLLEWKPGLPQFDYARLQLPANVDFPFADATEALGLAYEHVENPFVEFDRERLIPHMTSTEGPALAVGDANGDGLEDVFFGGAKRVPSALYLQQANGKFLLQTPSEILQDSLFEDVDAKWVDLDNDQDLDLVIASGGNEYRGQEEALRQRAYLNDGKGGFQRIFFPEVYMTASCVVPIDFNQDGLMDLFFGARAVPWNYGLTPASVLLQNKGNGQFEVVTDQVAPGLKEVGLVKNGTQADLDGDGDSDLILAIEWEPITIFLNQQGNFKKQTLDTRTGWWNFVLPYDFDGDGDLDLLAGNLGQNAKFKPTEKEPLSMYVADFDQNGQIEQLLTYFVKGKEIPFANHAEITKQLPMVKKNFLHAKDFAKAKPADLVGKDQLSKALRRQVNTLQSMYFENTGKGLEFRAVPLPDELQLSPIKASFVTDLNGDGNMEVLLGGNYFESTIEMGRYDANYGNVLRIGSNASFQVFPLGQLNLTGQVRRIQEVHSNGKKYYIFAKNDARAQVLGIQD